MKIPLGNATLRTALLLATLASSSALAQTTPPQTPPQTPPPVPPAPAVAPAPARAQAPLQRLLEGYREVLLTLDLTPDQRPAITAIMQQEMATLRELAPELQQASPSERRAKIAEFMQVLNSKIRAELDNSQQAKFDQSLGELEKSLRNPPATPPSPQAGRGATRPAERLAAQQPGNSPQSPAARILQQFKTAVESLDLTEEQKTKVNTAFAGARAKLSAIEPGDPTSREQQRAITDDLPKELTEILTPEQQAALRERMQQVQQQGNRPPRGDRPPRGGQGGLSPANPPSTPPGSSPGTSPGTPAGTPPGGPPFTPPAIPPGMMGDPPPAPPLDTPPPPRADQGSAHPAFAAAEGVGLELGSPAPAASLKKLDGTPVRLSSFSGRSVVLIFGSYSAPTFREKSKFINDLQQDFRGRTEIIVVYTAEAYPVGSGDVERNLDDKVRIEPHRSEADRIAAAKNAKSALKLNVTVAIDDMDNTTVRTFGGMPNGSVVISREGTIVARQHWFEPFALRRTLEELAKGKSPTTPSPAR